MNIRDAFGTIHTVICKEHDFYQERRPQYGVWLPVIGKTNDPYTRYLCVLNFQEVYPEACQVWISHDDVQAVRED